jgi:hypothetical protein
VFVIYIWELFDPKPIAVGPVVGKVALGQVSLNTSFFPLHACIVSPASPLTFIHVPLVVHNVSNWQHEDKHMYINKSKHSTLLAADMSFLMYKKSCPSLKILILFP